MRQEINSVSKFFVLLPMLLIGMMACQHDNSINGEIIPPDFDYGTDQIVMGDWNFDKSHSNVRWETMYLGSAALLTGRFNQFAIEEFEFYADRPEDCKLVGTVVLSTVNTGEPGRDDGCLQGTLGTDVNNEAKITATKFEYDGLGAYDVTADFEFHGFSDEVTMKFTYVGSTFFDESSGLFGAPFTVAGFSGTFEFNAKSDFAIESTSIADRVVVKCNAQFKKPE